MFEPPGYGKVAETASGTGGGGCGTKIVGLVRGCVKSVVSGSSHAKEKDPIYTKVAYILGLRVSPTHRYVFVLRTNNQETNMQLAGQMD